MIPFKDANFSTTDNLLGFFLFRDSLHHMGELSFGTLNSYFCSSGCSDCYLRSHWLSKEEFLAKNSQESLNSWMLSKTDSLFNLFSRVECLDDLRFLSRKYPNKFSFYQQKAKELSAPSLTDNAIFLQKDVIFSLGFKDIFQLAVSTSFLRKHFSKLLEYFEQYSAHFDMKIPVLKIILEAEQDTSLVNEFTGKCSRFFQKIETQSNVFSDNISSVESIPSDDTYISEVDSSGKAIMYRILNNFLILQNNLVFFTFEDAVKGNKESSCFDLLTQMPSAAQLCYTTLAKKLRLYEVYSRSIKDTSSKHYQYFKWVSSSFKINEEFNFIPACMLQPTFKICEALELEGFKRFSEGWVKLDGKPFTSIIEAL